MFETPAAKAGTAVLFAGLLSAEPFGISASNILMGMGFAAVGVLGRGFVDIATTLENGDRVKVARSLAWMGAMLVATPFISTVYMAILTSIHYPPDALAAIGLALISFAGSKGLNKLVNLAQSFLPARITGTPQGGPNGVP